MDQIQSNSLKWMQQMCQELSLNFNELMQFLIKSKGRIFGSFVLACLLKNRHFIDVDIIVPPIENASVRHHMSLIFGLDASVNELYEPRSVCNNCAKVNNDNQLYEYHRIHQSSKISIELIQSKDVDQHINECVFDVNKFYFTPSEGFVSPGRDLIQFVKDPSFVIVDFTKVMDFESIYDFWGFYCNCDTSGVLVDGCAKYDYPMMADSHCWKLKQMILYLQNNHFDLSDCAPWFNLNSSIDQIIKDCYNHFKLEHNESVTSYKICKTFLRAMKLVCRGLRCENLDQFFSLLPVDCSMMDESEMEKIRVYCKTPPPFRPLYKKYPVVDQTKNALNL